MRAVIPLLFTALIGSVAASAINRRDGYDSYDDEDKDDDKDKKDDWDKDDWDKDDHDKGHWKPKTKDPHFFQLKINDKCGYGYEKDDYDKKDYDSGKKDEYDYDKKDYDSGKKDEYDYDKDYDYGKKDEYDYGYPKKDYPKKDYSKGDYSKGDYTKYPKYLKKDKPRKPKTAGSTVEEASTLAAPEVEEPETLEVEETETPEGGAPTGETEEPPPLDRRADYYDDYDYGGEDYYKRCKFDGYAVRLEKGIAIATPYNKWWDPKLPTFFVDDDTQLYTVSKEPLQLYIDAVTGALKYTQQGWLPPNAIATSFYHTGNNPLGLIDPSPSFLTWPSTAGIAFYGAWLLCPLGYTGQYQIFINNKNFDPQGVIPDDCEPEELAASNANPWRYKNKKEHWGPW